MMGGFRKWLTFTALNSIDCLHFMHLDHFLCLVEVVETTFKEQIEVIIMFNSNLRLAEESRQ